jgi:hypothetical protein
MIFLKALSRDGRTRRFQISSVPGTGWEVLERDDDRVVKAVRYDDWHRVERILNTFRLEVSQLRQDGWTELA